VLLREVKLALFLEARAGVADMTEKDRWYEASRAEACVD
jgi:hypothetical protein